VSDVPELDKIIEESENVRRNKKWQRRDKAFKLTMLCLLLMIPIFLIGTVLFGAEFAAIITTGLLIFTLLPMAVEATFEIINDLLKDDWEGKDMTKRYNRK
jgi:hypothetical protein